jgi:hypothetical protein
MPRSEDAKMRRRNRKKDADATVIDMFGSSDTGEAQVMGGDPSMDFPMPPGMQTSDPARSTTNHAHTTTESAIPMPKKTRSKKKVVIPGSATATASDAPSTGGGGMGGIKRTPLILLILMTGTTLLPALIYAGDYFSSTLSKHHLLGSIGYRLGIGQVPRQRVTSFYEKHAPEKIPEVPTILAKHYGDYPQLIKRLERKYQDYGYFVGWEEDEAPLRLALEHVREAYTTWTTRYWNRYAPQQLKQAARNVRYNLTFLVKRVTKVWKRKVWPVLKPYLGVPDEREAARQKRQDAAEARKRRGTTSSKGTRRKNTDFRDDAEEHGEAF